MLARVAAPLKISLRSWLWSLLVHEPSGVSWNAAAVLRQRGTAHCHAFLMPDHCRSTAVAWCGSGAASVSLQSKSLRGSDQSLESGAAVSTPCASGSQPRDLSAPPGARDA